MDEQKRFKMAAAITVNVILLVVILTAVIIYQLVAIGVGNSQKKALQTELARYEQDLKQSEKDLEYLKSEQYLLDQALKLGYYFPD